MNRATIDTSELVGGLDYRVIALTVNVSMARSQLRRYWRLQSWFIGFRRPTWRTMKFAKGHQPRHGATGRCFALLCLGTSEVVDIDMCENIIS